MSHPLSKQFSLHGTGGGGAGQASTRRGWVWGVRAQARQGAWGHVRGRLKESTLRGAGAPLWWGWPDGAQGIRVEAWPTMGGRV